MSSQLLFERIKAKRSFLCVGLDTDPKRLPPSVGSMRNAVFEFNRAIVDATADLAIAFKMNLAFYEAMGAEGWACLDRTVRYINSHYPDVLTIADGKRGDIANTARMYAQSLYRVLGFDAVTIAPYMGGDAVQPFLDYEGRGVILLAVTSNGSYRDFQTLPVGDPPRNFYEVVVETSKRWGHDGNMMYVVGATHPEVLQKVRQIAPDHFLLVPGVGEQGGDFDSVVEHGMNRHCGLIVNSSRGIIYAGSGPDYAEAARAKAQELQQKMAKALEERKLL